MKFSTDQLREFLRDNACEFGIENVHSISEFLGYFYLQFHPIDSQEIQLQVSALEAITKTLSGKKQRKLLHAVDNIRTTHERQAFLEGFHLGARFMLELLDNQPTE